MPDAEIFYTWRGVLSGVEMVDLVGSHGGTAEAGWWDRVRPHSLGWVTARTAGGLLVGFVNVAWDGGDHAFLIDTKTRGEFQRRGIGADVVRQAAAHAKEAGCEWLHVDFRHELADFYLDACGFQVTSAGVIRLVMETGPHPDEEEEEEVAEWENEGGATESGPQEGGQLSGEDEE